MSEFMGMITFAALVDKQLPMKRSEMSLVQKNVSDTLILQHFIVGSSIKETVDIVKENLKALED